MDYNHLQGALDKFNDYDDISLFYDREKEYFFLEKNNLIDELMNSYDALDYIQVFMKRDKDEMRLITINDVKTVLEMFDIVI